MDIRLKQLGKDTLIYGLGGLLARAVGYLLLPVYTRVFTPTEYGHLEMVLVVNSFVTTLLVAGMDSAQSYYFAEAKKVGVDAEARVVSALVQWRLTVGVAVIAVAGLVSPLLNKWLLDGALSWEYFALSFVGAFFMQLMVQAADVYRLLYRAQRYVLVTLSSSLVAATVSLGLIFLFDFDILGIIVGTLVGGIAAAAVGWWGLRDRLRLNHWHIDWWPKLLRFGLPLMPAGLVAWVMSTADRWFVLELRSPGALGLYAVGAKISMLVAMAANIFRTAWWPLALDELQADRKDLFRLMARLYLGVGLIGVVILTAASPLVVRLLAGPAFAAAYPVAGVLAFSAIFYGLILISAIGIWKVAKTAWITVALGAGALVNVGLNALLVPPLGGLGAALATALSMATANIALLWWGERFWRVRFPFGVMLAETVVAGSAVAVLLYLLAADASDWLVVPTAAVAVLVLAALAFGRGGIDGVRRLLRRARR